MVFEQWQISDGVAMTSQPFVAIFIPSLIINFVVVLSNVHPA
jgi:hypothetical protein